jgi:hypothetical protein
MKIIIAGSRSITDFTKVAGILDDFWAIGIPITEVVCGMAKGVDSIGLWWAKQMGIPVKEFPADWDKYRRTAGPIRNKQMGDYADAAIVIYRPDISKGSKNMIETMKKLGKPVYTIEF